MGELIRRAIEIRREELIRMLLDHGVFKKNDLHLFQLTLTELEEEFRQILSSPKAQ
ncbi:Fur-regulated basic protein FbpA [Bacillus lacus]|uniref:Fur-regulated basic protein FbpA n=1 Tax=Metabacillus lacus TaxID=1983721 RepID=A0A7X2J0N8_9BACI|nr:Fur-regulated basic protein FbpA [Metabacillus lacus]MRX73275.1 Fur-regulated basic protein FbpA [Metabacillus lacus]